LAIISGIPLARPLWAASTVVEVGVISRYSPGETLTLAAARARIFSVTVIGTGFIR
jgi:hypothetical protein